MAVVFPYTSATAALFAVMGLYSKPSSALLELIVPLSYMVLSSWALYSGINLILYVGLAFLISSVYTLSFKPLWIVTPLVILIWSAVSQPKNHWVSILCTGLVVGKHIVDLF